MLKPGERLDDLQYKGLRIIQHPKKTCFSTDSVLLASFVKAFPSDRGADLGCGTGVLSILVNGRTGARIEAVEIQEDEADRAERSVRLNGQTGITVHHAGAAPKIALIECKKGAKHGMLFEPALIMHGDDGGYTEEMKEIYHIPAQPDR